MASGKLSPRQKMINMMYLVLTAMLALNVSQDILKVLHKLNSGMEETVKTVHRGTETLYTALDNATVDNPRAIEFNDRAKQVKVKTSEIFDMLKEAKLTLIKETGGRDPETGRLKGASNRDYAENYLLNAKAIGGEGMGQSIKETLSSFKDFMKIQADGDEEIIAALDATFDLNDVTEDGTKESWERATFGELPLAGIIPFMTDYQSRVRRMEAKIVEHLYSNIDANTIRFDAARAVVVPKSNFVTQGDFFEADIFLAAFDQKRNPIFEDIEMDSVNLGVGKFKMKASGIGEKTFSGNMSLPGSDTKYPISFSYTVAPPTVVISPTKMNVLYRNVENPLEVSVPGVAPKDLVVNGPGVTGSNGKYMADVTKIQGKLLTISVSVRQANGKLSSAGKKEFRIKGLPQAMGSIYKKTEGVMSSSLFSKAIVEAEYRDFPFDLALTVVSFELKLEGQAPIQITGDRIEKKYRERITRLRPGSTVIIRKIKAKTPKGTRLDKISPITIDVQ